MSRVMLAIRSPICTAISKRRGEREGGGKEGGARHEDTSQLARDLTRPFDSARLPGMRERYDIKPTPDGGWLVIDTGNSNVEVAKHKSHGEALREAIRRDR